MAHKFDGKPLLSVVSNSSELVTEAPSEPLVLALQVAEVLRKADLAKDVRAMRRSPAGWVDFLIQLHSLLEEEQFGAGATEDRLPSSTRR